jgi:hypothetical protein
MVKQWFQQKLFFLGAKIVNIRKNTIVEKNQTKAFYFQFPFRFF